MKRLVAKQKTKLAVVALILLFQVSQSVSHLSGVTWRVEAICNAEFKRCADNTIATQLQTSLNGAPDLNPIYIVSYFQAPTAGNPTCVQMAENVAGNLGYEPGVLTITAAVEANTANDPATGPTPTINSTLRYQNKAGLTNSQGDFGAIVEAQTSSIATPIPTGMAIFIAIQGGDSFYYFKDYGGYYQSCDPTCLTCGGGSNNCCTTCHSWANQAGAEIDSSLTGRCLCSAGNFNQAGTACDTSACHSSCKSCQGPAATDCIECADGFTSSSSTFPPTCVANPPPPPPPPAPSCPETCKTCDSSGNCLTCKTISQGGPLSLLNGECRCPAGKYFVTGEDRCADCHSSCQSCEGIGSNQCLTCTDVDSVVNKAPGSNAGTCVHCGDPARSSSPECSGTPLATLELSVSAVNTGTVTTLDSLTLENFKTAKVPVRIPEGGRHILSLKSEANFLARIKQLGDQFVVTDFLEVTIEGLSTPSDFTFAAAPNDTKDTLDLSFKFTKEHENVEVLIQVKQNNYFINNIPNKSKTRRRELQSFSNTSQAFIDSAPLFLTTALRANLTALTYLKDRIEFMEETGIIISIYTYFTVFLVSLILIGVMLCTKYDGRIIGRQNF